MAAADGVRNRMCWQRLSMVGSSARPVVADQHEHGVLRRLLQRLEQRVGGVAPHRLGLADQVRPPRRLERPQVQVAAQLADLVDQDRLALRLDDVQVGVLLGVDPVLVGAEHGGDEACAASSLPEPRGPYSRYAWLGSAAASASRRPASG